MYISHGMRLRFAALRQLLHDVRQKGNNAEDVVRFLGDRLKVALTGHLGAESVILASFESRDFIDDEEDLTDENVDRAFDDGIRRFLGLGTEASGLRTSYLVLADAHIRDCPDCRAMLRDEARDYWGISKETKALVEAVKEEDPEGFEALRCASDRFLRHH